MQVKFWFDVTCPWAYVTSRWYSKVANELNISTQWEIFSLSIKNRSNNKNYSDEMGTLALMYHRFNEYKYPSTIIQMNVFEQHIKIIKDKKYDFYDPKEFVLNFEKPKKDKKI